MCENIGALKYYMSCVYLSIYIAICQFSYEEFNRVENDLEKQQSTDVAKIGII